MMNVDEFAHVLRLVVWHPGAARYLMRSPNDAGSADADISAVLAAIRQRADCGSIIARAAELKDEEQQELARKSARTRRLVELENVLIVG